MNNTYTITTADGKLYIKETAQKVLDIADRRDMRDRYKPSEYAHLILTYDIHYTFADQLTLQISHYFYEMFNSEQIDSFRILLSDRYLIKGENCFYILLYLENDDIDCNFWVKCFADMDSLDLSKENLLRFDICFDDEQTAILHKCRFATASYSASITYLKDYLNEYFKRNSKKKEKKHLDSDGGIEYPDVIIRCHMKKRATKRLKDRIYKCICDYIDIWNSNDDNEDKIHYASLEEYAEDGDTIVSVFVDFANCDPSALVEMLEYLHDANDDIEDITLA